MNVLRCNLTTATTNALVHQSVRAVSSKYVRPKPRIFKRRLFEAAVQPVLPPTHITCTPPGIYYEQIKKQNAEYQDIEIALANLVKSWLRQNEFRVLALCHKLPVPSRQVWFAKNALRLKGLEFREYGAKIMKKVFDGTPLSSLDMVFEYKTAIVAGKDLASIKTIITESAKHHWLHPLAIAADDRIISLEEAKKLAELPSMEDVRGQTVQILQTQLGGLTQTLDSATQQTTNILGNLEMIKKGEEEK